MVEQVAVFLPFDEEDVMLKALAEAEHRVGVISSRVCETQRQMRRTSLAHIFFDNSGCCYRVAGVDNGELPDALADLADQPLTRDQITIRAGQRNFEVSWDQRALRLQQSH